uniref:Uncharacterized protein n=1 Tax=Pristionchus pacificus TaxID=54126 RepID=A0A2A6BXN9_PRIPA|eukprot:PDM70648.1 hypothetical protein PRIPAC_43853 [Pristionchus pacificus]
MGRVKRMNGKMGQWVDKIREKTVRSEEGRGIQREVPSRSEKRGRGRKAEWLVRWRGNQGGSKGEREGMDEIGRMEEDDERKDDEVIMKVFLERERKKEKERRM